MNSMTWIGIIVWGLFITGFGLASAGTPAGIEPDLHAQDVVFLISGGLVSILIGVAGLFGLMGWVPGARKDQETAA